MKIKENERKKKNQEKNEMSSNVMFDVFPAFIIWYLYYNLIHSKLTILKGIL